MPFIRNWDAACPRVWDQFESEGRTFVIQDLPPEDDKLAVQILVEHLSKDEALCSASNLINDQESVDSISEFWGDCITQRMSLACYTEVEGLKTLVALNVCVVDSAEEPFPTTPIRGVAWTNVYKGMGYLEDRRNAYEYLKMDVLLHAFGLVVKREFRGARLGAKLLQARQPLALAHGVKGTTTVFTGPASQSLAARCGFETIQEATFRELADAGLSYPKTEHVVKLMVKRFSED